MLRIFVMALIFSVELFTSVVFAKPRVSVLELETQQVVAGVEDLSEWAALYLEEKIFNSGRFTLIMSDEEWENFEKKFPEYDELEAPGADYVVVSKLGIVQAGRAQKFKITHTVDVVEGNVVIWSGEASKNFNANKKNRDDWYSEVYKLSDKVMKKFFKAIDSGKVELKE